MNDVRVDYAEQALIALLAAKLPAAYGKNVDVESLGDADFNENGQLVLKPPSVRVRFIGGKYDNLRDNQRLTYQANMDYDLWCYESSLRSAADQRKQTLVLVAAVQDVVTGGRLVLPDSSKTLPITMQGVQLVEVDAGPVDQLYSVAVTVEGIAQFSGANA